MIYIVSGDGPRCGSTMMLRALDKGGLPVVYMPECNEAATIQATDDYHPAPEGILELSLDYQRFTLGFPQPNIFNDRCLKLFPPPWGELLRICHYPPGYRIVWLHRPSRERYDSFYRFHAKEPLMWDMSRASEAEYARDTRACEALAILKQRRDVRVIEMEYHAVLDKPLKHMRILRNAGWPIDPHDAASVVDPDRCRFTTQG